MHIGTSHARVPHSLFLETSEKLGHYLAKIKTISEDPLYSELESSVRLPFDEKILHEVEDVYQKTAHARLKYVLVVGIGGSNLGAKAVYDALWGYHDVLEPERSPKVIWLDTSDETLILKTTALMGSLERPEEAVVIYISKSGNTSETTLNANRVWDVFGKNSPFARKRWVVITDIDSRLAAWAAKEELHILEIPKKVGGRFSVFSPSGLLPLRYCTGNLKAFLSGAESAFRECTKSGDTNPAILGAAALLYSKQQGRRVHDTFVFHPQLESLGKWYRQLLSESIGKEKNREGKVVREGILPTVSVGSTDLHSMGQLYLGGPRMSFTTFISAKAGESELMAAIRKGTQRAYAKQEMPFFDVVWDDVSLTSIGEYMQWKMLETMYLGELLELNAFDQPAVELYKAETRDILEGKIS